MLQIQSCAIELTNHCQLKCYGCWSQQPVETAPRLKGYMSFQMFKRVINELAFISKIRPVNIALSFGGESLLHPQFNEFVTHLKRSHLRLGNLRLYTNGLLLHKYLKTILQCRIMVSVSIHYPVLDVVKENVKLLVEARRNIPYGYRNGVFATFVKKEFPSLKALNEAVAFFAPLVDEKGIYPLITEDLQYVDADPKLGKCYSPFQYVAVLWNGDVLPCCHLLSPNGFSMGNVKGGLLNVWTNRKYADLRHGRVEGMPCEHCHVYEDGLAKQNELVFRPKKIVKVM